MSDVRVTVGIPAYNSASFIHEALASVLSQSMRCDEIIVVDDGSTDETSKIVEGFRGVRTIRQRNSGTAAARNRAIDEATGDYIAFLDADDVWLPEKLKLQMSCLMDRPELAMVYSGLRVVDGDLRPIEDLVAARGDVAFRNTFLLEKPYMTGIGSTSVVRLDVARAIRFDLRLAPSEDWAFACEVAMRWPVEGITEPLALYRQHARTQAHHNLKAVEHDVTLVWSEKFEDPALDQSLRVLRRRALANLSLSLSASYFKSGDRSNFVRYLCKALATRPDRVVAALWRRYMVPPS